VQPGLGHSSGGDLVPLIGPATADQVRLPFGVVSAEVLSVREEAGRRVVDVRSADPRGHLGARDFAVDVMVGKYLDHLPLERQVRITAREGLAIDSQTLWDYLERIGRILKPAYDRPHAYLLTLRVLGVDESHWRLLDAKGQDAGINKKWFVWGLVGPDAAFYQIEDSRSTKAAERVLEGFSAILVVDGYAVYERLSKLGKGFTLAFCWSHVRRKYMEAEPHSPAAGEAIELINELNASDRALRGVFIGRKNHYGSRSRRGTEVAAICYGLLESA